MSQPHSEQTPMTPSTTRPPQARRTWLTTLALLFALLLATPTLASAQDVTMEGYPATGEPSFVKVTEPGAEPRTALRYNISDGYTSHMAMTMLMGMTMNIDGMPLPKIEMPAIKMGADMAVTAVSPTKDITYRIAFTSMDLESTPGVDPNLIAALKPLGEDIKAIQGTATVSERGINKEVNFDLSKLTNPQLKQMMSSLSSSMENLSMPLPEEPVGVGARWEVRQSVAVNGMQTFQRVELEMTAFDGKTATLTAKITQTAPAQAIKSPDMPPGAEAYLKSLSGSGSGTMTLHFDELIPSSSVNMQTATAMEVKFGGQSQNMNIDMSMKIEIDSVKK
jgi:hypothetical protein